MCLAVPAKITELDETIATCRVGDTDTIIQANTMLVDGDPKVGDYIIVHAGFALRVLDPKEAEETLKILRDMAEMLDEDDLM